MSVFSNSAFDEHENVHFWHDQASGLRAIIAIHSSARGPAAGGCRAWAYDSSDAALTDVLRLSRGMSYKNAMAGLNLGGGKAVILRQPGCEITDATMHSFGRFVDSLNGRYITAEDVGMSVSWMQTVATETRFVAGLPPKGDAAGGDPSPTTALGTYHGIRAAVARQLGKDSLRGLKIAVQGVGNVGMHLCELLAEDNCELWVADVNAERLAQANKRFDAKVVALDEILFQDVDVISPCALGAVLNRESIPKIKSRVIAGAANNQLATAADGQRLLDAGILYCPDYVINAGGIINVSSEYEGDVSQAEVVQQVEAIGPRLGEIFEQAARDKRSTSDIADEMARSLIGR